MEDVHLEEWEALRAHAKRSKRPLQLVVGPSADAAAATRSLTLLFEQHFIQTDVHPVETFNDVRLIAQSNAQTVEQLAFLAPEEDDEGGLKRHQDAYLLIGCGATIDVSQYFTWEAVALVHILDAARPVHLTNLRHPNITVWSHAEIVDQIDQFFSRIQLDVAHSSGGGNRRKRTGHKRRRRTTTKALQPNVMKKHRRTEGDNNNDEEDKSSGSATDNDDAALEDLSEESYDLEDDDDAEDLSDDDYFEEGEEAEEFSDEASALSGDDERKKLTRRKSRRVNWLEGEGVSKQAEDDYFATVWTGRSSALSIFDLANALGNVQEIIVWCAAIGVADLRMSEKTTAASYSLDTQTLHDAIRQLQAARRTALQPQASNVPSSSASKAARGVHWSLDVCQQQRLFLLRHWNLWDALWHDSIVASRLGLHHADRGSEELKQMLARMGVSITAAQRPWAEHPLDQQKQILTFLEKELRQLGVFSSRDDEDGLQVRVVARVTGVGQRYTAYDACQLFYAQVANVSSTTTSDPSVTSASTTDGQPKTDDGTRKASSTYRAFFWQAYDVLELAPSSKRFHLALQNACNLQYYIEEATRALMQPGEIERSKTLYYGLMDEKVRGSPVFRHFGTSVRLTLLSRHVLKTLVASSQPQVTNRREQKLVKPNQQQPSACLVLGCRMLDLEGTSKSSSDVHSSSSDRFLLCHAVPPKKVTLSPVVDISTSANNSVIEEARIEHDINREFVNAHVVEVTGRDAIINVMERLYIRLDSIQRATAANTATTL